MGHLGNPIAFRLSIKKKWNDIWFVKNLYYPEYIHSIINFKDFIYYYLSRKILLLTGFYFSHLFVLKHNKKYILKIYCYHIDLEKSTLILINKLYESYYKLLFNKTYLKKKKKEKEDIILQNIHNSDVFVSYFLSYIIIKGKQKHFYFKNVFNNNVFNNNESKYYIKNVKSFFIDFILECINEKKTQRISYRYPEVKRYFYLYKSLKKKKNLNAIDISIIKQLEKCKLFFKNLKNKCFVKKFLSMYKIHNKRFLLNRNIKKIPIDLKVKKKKLSFLYFTMYILKKVGFKKYKNNEKFGIYFRKAFKIFNIYKKFKVSLNFLYFYFYNISLYLMLYKKIKKQEYPNTILKFNFRNVLYGQLYNYLYNLYIKLNLYLVFNVLKYYIFIINDNIKDINFNIFFMTNNNVTACFLSKYIALRLKKNFNFKRTLFIVKRQLSNLMSKGKLNKNVYKIYDYIFLLNLKKKKIKNFFFKLFFYIFLLLKNKIWLLFKINDFLGFFNVYLYQKFLKLKNLVKLIIYNSFFGIFKINFISFFNVKLDLSNIYYINLLYSQLLKFFNNRTQIVYKNVLKKKIIFINSFFFKNYINFVFLKHFWSLFHKINLRNIRQRYFFKYKSILMGFKIVLKGRFSRKQRASSILLQQGKVPLNTLNIDIDYSFYTIPLKNSAISIKLWLYKNKICDNFKKFINI